MSHYRAIRRAITFRFRCTCGWWAVRHSTDWCMAFCHDAIMDEIANWSCINIAMAATEASPEDLCYCTKPCIIKSPWLVKDNFEFSSLPMDWHSKSLHQMWSMEGDRKRFSCNLVTEGLVSHEWIYPIPYQYRYSPFPIQWACYWFAFVKKEQYITADVVGSYIYINGDLDILWKFMDLVHWWN